MKRSLALLVFVLSLLPAVPGAEPNQPAQIAVIVIHAEGGTAQSAERVELPKGLRLSEFFMNEKTYKLRSPLRWTQGFVELRRLGGPRTASVSLKLTQRETRSTAKADIVLENGDIVISDMWPDL